MGVERNIIIDLADRECRRVSTSVVRRLQKLKGDSMLSGNDSGLANTWDEICVQVQSERSFFWDIYLATADNLVERAVNNLEYDLLMAIWLQTADGSIWDAEEDEIPEAILDDVARYILEDYILSEAQRWSNRRIISCLEERSEI